MLEQAEPSRDEGVNAAPRTKAATRSVRLAAGVLVLAVLAAYHSCFFVPFIFDDTESVVGNGTIRHLWPIRVPLTPPGGAITVSSRPVLNLSFALNYALGRKSPWGYHAANLAIHLLAGLALFGVVRRTLLLPRMQERYRRSALPLALAVGLLWALHPLQTEAVTYVSQRAESLMGLFYLLTLYCFIRALSISNLKSQISNPWHVPLVSNFKSRISNYWYVLCVGACLLGMGTKEVMVSAPLMVLLYDRTFVAGSFLTALRRRWGVYAGLAATWLLLARDFGGQQAEINATVGVWPYLLTQSWAVAHYLWLTAWPRGLLFDYGTLLIKSMVQAAPYGVVVLSLLAGTVACLWAYPELGFLGCWFFAILAPTSSVLPLGGQTVAEHRMYLALAAIIVAFVLGVHRLANRGRRQIGADHPPRRSLIGVNSWEVVFFSVVALALALGAARRNHAYQSSFILWSDTVSKRPENASAQNNLGLAWFEAGRVDQAIAHYRRALEIEPGNIPALNNFGYALLQMGQTNEAIVKFQTALASQPADAPLYNNMGVALFDKGLVDEAIAHYHRALDLQPDYAEAHNNLGSALLYKQQTDDAVAEFKAAIAAEPDCAGAHYNLGTVLHRQGRVEDAIKQYRQALRIQPGMAAAHNNLGNALARIGQAAEAIEHFEKAVAIQPDMAGAIINLANAQLLIGRVDAAIANYRKAIKILPDSIIARKNLAWVLATCPEASVRNGAQAVELARQADELSGGNDPGLIGILAAAYAESGQFDQAAAAAQRGIQLAGSQGNSPVSQRLQTELAAYQAGSPLRDSLQKYVRGSQ